MIIYDTLEQTSPDTKGGLCAHSMNIFLCHLKVTIHIFTHDYRDPDAMFKIFLLAALGRTVLAVPAEAIQGQ